jgi:hypothetical protein
MRAPDLHLFSGDDAWTSAMRRGDFESAWNISDAVLSRRRERQQTCWEWPRHFQYVWTGTSLLAKRVLVRCYHGLGDTVQFIRFAAPLRRLAHHVAVWSQPELVDLVATAAGVDQVLPLHDGVPELDYDVDIEIMEVPHALRVTKASIPRTVPYLFPSGGAHFEKPQATLSVGLIWQAGDWDPRRNIPADLLRPLADVTGIRLFSLQRGPAAAAASLVPAEDIGGDDVNETAAQMLALDLIISVDTMAAHLAGALGRPVWTLLHSDCDWRWLNDDADCVWYPTMRLFRQRCAGDWSSVMHELGIALTIAARDRSSSSMLLAR